jgi:hypothetical protein
MVWQQYRLLDQEPRMLPHSEDSQLVLKNLSQQGKFDNILHKEFLCTKY